MSAAELLLGPGATGAGVADVPWFGPIIGMLCVAPPVLVGIDAFSAPASDRGESIAGEAAPLQPTRRLSSYGWGGGGDGTRS